MCCQNTISCLQCFCFVVKLEACTPPLHHVQPVMIGPDTEDAVCWEPTQHTHQLVVCDGCYTSDDVGLRSGIFDQARIDRAVQHLAKQNGGLPYVNVIKLLPRHSTGFDEDEVNPNDDTGCRYWVPVNISLAQ